MASTVTYDDAVSTLRAMFTDMDRAVIVNVLEQNHGHLERTIDDLLAMKAAEEIALGESNEQATVPTGAPDPRGRNAAPDTLPDDFLSLDSNPAAPHAGPEFLDEATRQQIEEDERLARMLQDELFLEQLSQNEAHAQEFGGVINAGRNAAQGRAAAGDTGNAASAYASANSVSDSAVTIRQKLASLGAAAKERLSALADSFRGTQEPRKRENPGMYSTLPNDAFDSDEDAPLVVDGQRGSGLREETEMSTFRHASGNDGVRNRGSKKDD